MASAANFAILTARKFPVGELRLLATSRSAGRKVIVGERELTVEETTNDLPRAPTSFRVRQRRCVEAVLPHRCAGGGHR
jgi:aspartate-semialdehyde dehydrogenase